MARLDETAMAEVLKRTPVVASLARQVVEYYLEARIAKQIRQRATSATRPSYAMILAGMKVWDSLVWETPLVGGFPQLHTSYKVNARILMGNPNADWTAKTLDFGIRVTRIR